MRYLNALLILDWLVSAVVRENYWFICNINNNHSCTSDRSKRIVSQSNQSFYFAYQSYKVWISYVLVSVSHTHCSFYTHIVSFSSFEQISVQFFRVFSCSKPTSDPALGAEDPSLYQNTDFGRQASVASQNDAVTSQSATAMSEEELQFTFERAVAEYSYQSAESEDLTFNVGDVIQVTKKDGDWWTGTTNGR